ncbi:MAG: PEP/pyruvate-binding domain-containing protein [Desulforhopalus sp.]
MLLNALLKHWSYRIIAPGTLLREKYEALKRLLQFDVRCHEEMAEFQELLHDDRREDLARIRKRFASFSAHVSGMVASLDAMDPGTYSSLKNYHKKFDFYVRFLLAPPAVKSAPPYVFHLSEIAPDNDQIGNKAKHLAALQKDTDIPVPRGFAVTASGFHHFIAFNNLKDPLEATLAELDISSSSSLNRVSASLTKMIRQATVPPDIEAALLDAYDSWQETAENSPRTRVAVRSNALSEDGDFSFAGLYETVLNVPRQEIALAYREVIASKYAAEALFYRVSKGLGDEETAMSVLVQEMIAASSSGVLYTRGVTNEVDSQDRFHLYVARGAGDQLVSGAVTPDCYVLSNEQEPALIAKYTSEPIIGDGQAREIAAEGWTIEQFFRRPQDIEWAIDERGGLYILQARELHLPRHHEPSGSTCNDDVPVLAAGCERASAGVATGVVYRVKNIADLDDVPAGAVLVSRDSPPAYVRVLSRVSAVLAEHGSRASHFATVAREFGVPFLTGIEDACDRFEAGTLVTVDGNDGTVYQGRIDRVYKDTGRSPHVGPYHRILSQALKFITPLELIDPAGDNFLPEGCRSMHDIIRFCHEKALQALFSAGRPGTGRGALRLLADIPLDVYLFDVGDGLSAKTAKRAAVPLDQVLSVPFHALWKGLSHPDVQWKQKPFDWNAFDKIELAGGVPPSKDSFAFASYAVVGTDYLHFNIRFGYHFTIVDAMCGENSAENHCLLRFAGGGGDYQHLSLRIEFLALVLERLGFVVEKKGDFLEAKLMGVACEAMQEKLDILGRLLGASKLMDMVLTDEQMVARCVEDFYNGQYSFSQEG